MVKRNFLTFASGSKKKFGNFQRKLKKFQNFRIKVKRFVTVKEEEFVVLDHNRLHFEHSFYNPSEKIVHLILVENLIYNTLIV